MPQLELTDQEVTNLANVLMQTTSFPWLITNPLLVKVLPLVQRQRSANGQPPEQPQPNPNVGTALPGYPDLSAQWGTARSVRRNQGDE